MWISLLWMLLVMVKKNRLTMSWKGILLCRSSWASNKSSVIGMCPAEDDNWIGSISLWSLIQSNPGFLPNRILAHFTFPVIAAKQKAVFPSAMRISKSCMFIRSTRSTNFSTKLVFLMLTATCRAVTPREVNGIRHQWGWILK